MALTADVHPGDVVASPWGNEIRNRSLQTFASTAERDAQWATAPNGAVCIVVTGTDAVLYQKRAGTWQALHLTGLLVDGAVTVTGAATVGTTLAVNQAGGPGVVGLQAQAAIASNWQVAVNKNSVDKSWANAQVLSQGDTGNGARVSMFNPSVGGQQIGVFGGGAAGSLYLLDHNGTTRGTINFTGHVVGPVQTPHTGPRRRSGRPDRAPGPVLRTVARPRARRDPDPAHRGDRRDRRRGPRCVARPRGGSPRARRGNHRYAPPHLQPAFRGAAVGRPGRRPRGDVTTFGDATPADLVDDAPPDPTAVARRILEGLRARLGSQAYRTLDDRDPASRAAWIEAVGDELARIDAEGPA